LRSAETHPLGSRDWFDRLEARTLPELIEARAARYGNKILVHIADEQISYADAHRRSDSLASGLSALGFRPGDRIASFRHNCVEEVVLWFACSKLGVVWVPLNVSLVERDLTYTLNDCGARMLVVDAAGLAAYGEVRDRIKLPEYEVLSSEVEPPPDSEYMSFDVLMSEGEFSSSAVIGPGTPCAVTYTGGSTGMPKGVIIPHFAYVATGMRYQEATGATDADTMVALGHLFHVGGQQVGLMGPMFCGMTTVLSKWFSASGYWDLVRRYKATIIDPFGSVVVPLLRQPASERDREHNVRSTVGTGTGGLPPGARDEFEARFGVAFNEVYAQTEVGCMLVNWRPWDQRAGSCGRAHGWADVAVLNESDQPQPAGATGQIALRPLVPHTFMLGYLNKPEMTVNSWRNQWHHTGDLGYLDSDGYLYFVGRAAHWMRVRGENVSALEVESVISELREVAEVAVVGVPAERGEDDVKAYVILKDRSAPFDPAVIVDACEAVLAYFKVPRYVEVVADFPRTLVKQEVRRQELVALGVGEAWDAAAHGRQARRRPRR
jgi:carnitine-CoA ligase